ncbi:hypothetical protein PE074_05895 [Wohlfahrtiimonas chitiniclastica]|uniref:Uncharacterized protein n=2 Tax=Wohlfahrtiimonas chitiniclastica TaxID=400946 RepID=L8Y216_9GAMM|nr:hypothetical protein [Wohlfahrtiimonas chitiniclastica]ELV09069.1 Hypothetical protein F387_00961 [Wohlfahrtiimonas chitiniclastica SH04]KZX37719.1 hypothetical protein A6V30_02260 [Wohlfahrtiimonas chitiniclastica]MBS7814657.1 hypothetical protein [Wohlfahrtiimonas chitiniclastica]MBS7817195.1 hypothetical protein [Wohlfahrtiimonas chitiniclastica]MBS7818921.1 hypothetical protein [Wohlfahrtiimonas chitiniclastica]
MTELNKNLIYKNVQMVSYKCMDKEGEEFSLVKEGDDQFVIAHITTIENERYGSHMEMTRADLEEFVKNIQEQLLGDHWVKEE